LPSQQGAILSSRSRSRRKVSSSGKQVFRQTTNPRCKTAFREHDIVGFFPVKVMPGNPNDPNGPQPTFSFQIAEGNNVSLDPETGMPRAAALKTVTYRMEGNLVRAVLPQGAKPASTRNGAV